MSDDDDGASSSSSSSQPGALATPSKRLGSEDIFQSLPRSSKRKVGLPADLLTNERRPKNLQAALVDYERDPEEWERENVVVLDSDDDEDVATSKKKKERTWHPEELRRRIFKPVLRSLSSVPAPQTQSQEQDGPGPRKKLKTGPAPSGGENTPEQERQLVFNLAGAVEKGLGTVVILLGPRGVGKTLMVNRAVASLGPASSYLLVRLNGIVQTTDRLALREIARQLARQGAFVPSQPAGEDEEGDAEEQDEIEAGSAEVGMTSHASIMSLMIRLLEPPATEQDKDKGGKTKPLIIILDSLDLFALHPRQSFLYSLFDIVQGNKRTGGLAVVGVSARLDAVSMLEKRVRSRCQSQVLHVTLSSMLPPESAAEEEVAMDVDSPAPATPSKGKGKAPATPATSPSKKTAASAKKGAAATPTPTKKGAAAPVPVPEPAPAPEPTKKPAKEITGLSEQQWLDLVRRLISLSVPQKNGELEKAWNDKVDEFLENDKVKAYLGQLLHVRGTSVLPLQRLFLDVLSQLEYATIVKPALEARQLSNNVSPIPVPRIPFSFVGRHTRAQNEGTYLRSDQLLSSLSLLELQVLVAAKQACISRSNYISLDMMWRKYSAFVVRQKNAQGGVGAKRAVSKDVFSAAFDRLVEREIVIPHTVGASNAGTAPITATSLVAAQVVPSMSQQFRLWRLVPSDNQISDLAKQRKDVDKPLVHWATHADGV